MRRSAAIGFDRRVRCEWLDAVAAKQAAGTKIADIRRFGHRLLRREYPGDDARGKTLTVMFHLWVDVPETAVVTAGCSREAAVRGRSCRARWFALGTRARNVSVLP